MKVEITRQGTVVCIPENEQEASAVQRMYMVNDRLFASVKIPDRRSVDASLIYTVAAGPGPSIIINSREDV